MAESPMFMEFQRSLRRDKRPDGSENRRGRGDLRSGASVGSEDGRKARDEHA